MEIEGHPTQDIVDEMLRRGARVVPGDSEGLEATVLAGEALPASRGFWLFVPDKAYDTEIDEPPPTGP